MVSVKGSTPFLGEGGYPHPHTPRNVVEGVCLTNAFLSIGKEAASAFENLSVELKLLGKKASSLRDKDREEAAGIYPSFSGLIEWLQQVSSSAQTFSHTLKNDILSPYQAQTLFYENEAREISANFDAVRKAEASAFKPVGSEVFPRNQQRGDDSNATFGGSPESTDMLQRRLKLAEEEVLKAKKARDTLLDNFGSELYEGLKNTAEDRVNRAVKLRNIAAEKLKPESSTSANLNGDAAISLEAESHRLAAIQQKNGLAIRDCMEGTTVAVEAFMVSLSGSTRFMRDKVDAASRTSRSKASASAVPAPRAPAETPSYTPGPYLTLPASISGSSGSFTKPSGSSAYTGGLQTADSTAPYDRLQSGGDQGKLLGKVQDSTINAKPPNALNSKSQLPLNNSHLKKDEISRFIAVEEGLALVAEGAALGASTRSLNKERRRGFVSGVQHASIHAMMHAEWWETQRMTEQFLLGLEDFGGLLTKYNWDHPSYFRGIDVSRVSSVFSFMQQDKAAVCETQSGAFPGVSEANRLFYWSKRLLTPAQWEFIAYETLLLCYQQQSQFFEVSNLLNSMAEDKKAANKGVRTPQEDLFSTYPLEISADYSQLIERAVTNHLKANKDIKNDSFNVLRRLVDVCRVKLGIPLRISRLIASLTISTGDGYGSWCSLHPLDVRYRAVKLLDAYNIENCNSGDAEANSFHEDPPHYHLWTHRQLCFLYTSLKLKFDRFYKFYSKSTALLRKFLDEEGYQLPRTSTHTHNGLTSQKEAHGVHFPPEDDLLSYVKIVFNSESFAKDHEASGGLRETSLGKSVLTALLLQCRSFDVFSTSFFILDELFERLESGRRWSLDSWLSADFNEENEGEYSESKEYRAGGGGGSFWNAYHRSGNWFTGKTHTSEQERTQRADLQSVRTPNTGDSERRLAHTGISSNGIEAGDAGEFYWEDMSCSEDEALREVSTAELIVRLIELFGKIERLDSVSRASLRDDRALGGGEEGGGVRGIEGDLVEFLNAILHEGESRGIGDDEWVYAENLSTGHRDTVSTGDWIAVPVSDNGGVRTSNAIRGYLESSEYLPPVPIDVMLSAFWSYEPAMLQLILKYLFRSCVDTHNADMLHIAASEFVQMLMLVAYVAQAGVDPTTREFDQNTAAYGAAGTTLPPLSVRTLALSFVEVLLMEALRQSGMLMMHTHTVPHSSTAETHEKRKLLTNPSNAAPNEMGALGGKLPVLPDSLASNTPLDPSKAIEGGGVAFREGLIENIEMEMFAVGGGGGAYPSVGGAGGVSASSLKVINSEFVEALFFVLLNFHDFLYKGVTTEGNRMSSLLVGGGGAYSNGGVGGKTSPPSSARTTAAKLRSERLLKHTPLDCKELLEESTMQRGIVGNICNVVEVSWWGWGVERVDDKVIIATMRRGEDISIFFPSRIERSLLELMYCRFASAQFRETLVQILADYRFYLEPESLSTFLSLWLAVEDMMQTGLDKPLEEVSSQASFVTQEGNETESFLPDKLYGPTLRLQMFRYFICSSLTKLYRRTFDESLDAVRKTPMYLNRSNLESEGKGGEKAESIAMKADKEMTAMMDTLGKAFKKFVDEVQCELEYYSSIWSNLLSDNEHVLIIIYCSRRELFEALREVTASPYWPESDVPPGGAQILACARKFELLCEELRLIFKGRKGMYAIPREPQLFDSFKQYILSALETRFQEVEKIIERCLQGEEWMPMKAPDILHSVSCVDIVSFINHLYDTVLELQAPMEWLSPIFSTFLMDLSSSFCESVLADCSGPVLVLSSIVSSTLREIRTPSREMLKISAKARIRKKSFYNNTVSRIFGKRASIRKLPSSHKPGGAANAAAHDNYEDFSSSSDTERGKGSKQVKMQPSKALSAVRGFPRTPRATSSSDMPDGQRVDAGNTIAMLCPELLGLLSEVKTQFSDSPLRGWLVRLHSLFFFYEKLPNLASKFAFMVNKNEAARQSQFVSLRKVFGTPEDAPLPSAMKTHHKAPVDNEHDLSKDLADAYLQDIIHDCQRLIEAAIVDVSRFAAYRIIFVEFQDSVFKEMYEKGFNSSNMEYLVNSFHTTVERFFSQAPSTYGDKLRCFFLMGFIETWCFLISELSYEGYLIPDQKEIETLEKDFEVLAECIRALDMHLTVSVAGGSEQKTENVITHVEAFLQQFSNSPRMFVEALEMRSQSINETKKSNETIKLEVDYHTRVFKGDDTGGYADTSSGGKPAKSQSSAKNAGYWTDMKKWLKTKF